MFIKRLKPWRKKVEIKQLQNKDFKAWLNALIQLGKDAGVDEPEAKSWAERFLVIVEGALVIQRLTNDLQTFERHMEYEKKQFSQFLAQQ